MSYLINAARKMDDRQLQVASDSQNVVVDLAKKVASYADRAPGMPGPFHKLVEPIESVFGSPTEFIRSVVESNRQWTEAWLDFSTKISDVFTPVAEPAVVEPTPIREVDFNA
jgi:hypothetical protein